jgi:hypothetical protein
MGEFFLGWRRKIGVATLAIACLLMSVWVRSIRRVDVLHYRGELGDIRLVASRRGLMWISDRTISPWEKEPPFYWEYESDKDGGAFEGMLDYVHKKYSRVFGICYRHSQPTSRVLGTTILAVPYWIFVTPMTLLSA